VEAFFDSQVALSHGLALRAMLMRIESHKVVCKCSRILEGQIEEAGQPVVAPYPGWQPLVAYIRTGGVSRIGMRRLQPYLVNLYPQEIAALEKSGAIEMIEDTFWSVVPGFYWIYSQRWGFGWQAPLVAEPESLIA
jgi:hypothetical protein